MRGHQNGMIFILDIIQKYIPVSYTHLDVYKRQTVAIAAFVAAALGFCIARFRFPGRSFLFLFIMLTMIIPGTTLIVPQYELAVKLKVKMCIRDRVMEEMNYHPNSLASNLVNGSTFCIGLIMDARDEGTFSNTFFKDVYKRQPEMSRPHGMRG